MTTRVPLSTEDIIAATTTAASSSSSDDNDDSYYAKIPILKRRAATAAAATSSGPPSSTSGNEHLKKDPICVIVVGMAGSGKTTLMAQLQRSLNLRDDDDDGDAVEDDENTSSSTQLLPGKRAGYAINLDPAAKYIPFTSSIDIRDTVNYIEVMKQHKLGPNGAILTCLNLFATKFDQVMNILERRAFPEESGGDGGGGEGKEEESNNNTDETTRQSDNNGSDDNKNNNNESAGNDANNNNDNNSTPSPPPETASASASPLDYVLIDTPGQIEAFTWSASGTIVTSALATTFPTVLAFVVDTPRCAASVHTFMSNMLYACSMLYRAKLPMVIVLNKIDVVGCEFVKEWMEDYDSFQEALDDASAANGYSDEMAGGGSGYYASLTRSLSLVLDEFYNHLHKVGVSAATGEGVEEFWSVVEKAAEDYEEGYLVDLRNRVEEQRVKERAMQRVGARKLVRDLQEDGQL